MKLLKILCFLFAIYFIRRLWQLYQFWKSQHDLKDAMLKQQQQAKTQATMPKSKVVDADFKVVD